MPYHLVVLQSINFHHRRWLYLYGHNLLIPKHRWLVWFFFLPHSGFKICHGEYLGLITTIFFPLRDEEPVFHPSIVEMKAINSSTYPPRKRAGWQMSSEANEATPVPVWELLYNMFKTRVYFLLGFKTVRAQMWIIHHWDCWHLHLLILS